LMENEAISGLYFQPISAKLHVSWNFNCSADDFGGFAKKILHFRKKSCSLSTEVN